MAPDPLINRPPQSGSINGTAESQTGLIISDRYRAIMQGIKHALFSKSPEIALSSAFQFSDLLESLTRGGDLNTCAALISQIKLLVQEDDNNPTSTNQTGESEEGAVRLFPLVKNHLNTVLARFVEIPKEVRELSEHTKEFRLLKIPESQWTDQHRDRFSQLRQAALNVFPTNGGAIFELTLGFSDAKLPKPKLSDWEVMVGVIVDQKFDYLNISGARETLVEMLTAKGEREAINQLPVRIIERLEKEELGLPKLLLDLFDFDLMHIKYSDKSLTECLGRAVNLSIKTVDNKILLQSLVIANLASVLIRDPNKLSDTVMFYLDPLLDCLKRIRSEAKEGSDLIKEAEKLFSTVAQASTRSVT